MINYETILSSYDDKLTLMQWLKKVEAALKDASAVSFKVNKTGDATLTFSIVFNDGTEIESGPLTLEQGESVQSAAIRNGHLILTLTNGDELDAGDLGGVSGFSIDASQHLIVTYQSGRTQDLGAIFAGNVVLNGNLAVNGDILMNNRALILEGNITEAETKPEGVHLTYAKYSLSGTHLIIVIAGYVDANVTIASSATDWAIVDVPEFIGRKIYSLGTSLGLVGGYSFDLTSAELETYRSLFAGIFKISNKRLTIPVKASPVYTTAHSAEYFRVQVDLLIDLG